MDLRFAARSGWAAARSVRPALRWRRASLIAASSVVTGALSLLVGLGAMRTRVDQRLQDRSLTESMGAGAPLAVHVGTDTRGDRQWDVVWVEADAGAPRPPGLRLWPEPGTFAVSPALARDIEADAALAARYASFTVIGDDGIQDRTERFAYATPRSGEAFGASVQRFAGFGGGNARGDETRRPTSTILLAAVVCVLGPAILLVRAATACAADERAERAVTLHWIGAPRVHLRVVAIIETAPSVVLGAATAAVAAMASLARIDRIPFAGVAPVPGDLAVPAWQLATVAGAVVAVTLGLAAVRGGRRPAQGPRPRVDRAPSRFALVPAALAAALLAWTALRPAGSGGAMPAVATTTAMILGVPLGLPFVARSIGRGLATSRSVMAQLAGRRSEADPIGSVRPLLVRGALLFALLTTAGYVAAVSVTDPPPTRDPHLDAATVLSFGGGARAFERFQRALPDDIVAPFLDDGPTLGVGASCRDLARVIDRPCVDGERLSTAAERRLSALLDRPAGYGLGIRLDPDVAFDSKGSTFVLVVGPRRPDLARRVEVAASRTLLAPEVSTLGNLRPRPSALWGWIRLGIAMTATLLTGSVVVSLGDRFATAAQRHRTLHLLGLDGARLRRMEAAQVAILYLATVGVTGAAGLANAIVMARTAPGARLPIEIVVVAAVLALVLAMVCVVLTDATSRASLRQRA